jgi:tetratricopeptide (TPR) repeat protein
LSTADLATKLDPLSDEGLKAAATIATHRGLLAAARSYLFDAIRREPNDAGAWEQLAGVDIQLGDRRGLLGAANRALALDPHGKLAFGIALDAYALLAPTTDPPTVTKTPLPSG